MKRIYFTFILMGFTVLIYSQISNPAAHYCKMLGYEYIIKKDSLGNEAGYCILPDSSEVEEWAFYRGKVGQAYSYCARKGYVLKIEKIQKGNFLFDCQVCENDTEKILMEDLMKRNKDQLFEVDITYDTSIINFSNLPQQKSTKSLPASFDWRDYGYINPIRNQGSCYSCYAFSAISAAEGVYNIATHRSLNDRVQFSESFVMWCLGGLSVYYNHFFGCSGADYSYSELAALKDYGVCYQNNFPYTATNPGECTHWNDPHVHFQGWNRSQCNDIEGIKYAILNYGPVDAAVFTTTGFTNYPDGYPDGIYYDANTSCPSGYDTETDHAISLIGWGIQDGYSYWILRNSWGTGWGYNGYMKISMTSARVACAVAYLYPYYTSEWKPIDCPTTVVNNQVITSNVTYTGCEIQVSNVTIQNNADVIFDHDFMTEITGLFEVKSGSTLEIK